MKKLSIIFLILYITSVIMTSVSFVPKFSDSVRYYNRMTNNYGYYFLLKSTKTFDNGHAEFATVDLKTDYQQWLMITFVESVVFLLPFILLRKKRKE